MKTKRTLFIKFLKNHINKGISLTLLIVILLSGCGTVNIISSNGVSQNASEINILLSSRAPRLSVILDDEILLDARIFTTRRVNINNVSPGEHKLEVTATSWKLKEPLHYTEIIDIPENKNVSLIIEVPPYSTGYWVYLTVSIVTLTALSIVTTVVTYKYGYNY